MDERRRRVPRQEAGRPGKYLFENDPESAWGECQILDISVLGARLEIREPLQHDLIGREITLEVQKAGAVTGALSTSRLVGVIRNVASGSEGGIQMGIQFVGDLPWSEHAVLDAYDRMQMFW
jgi:hypothetical protein